MNAFQLRHSMNVFHDKILYGISSLAAAFFSTLGAILTEGEVRHLYVTFTSSILTAGFLALMFKAPLETIRLTVGRSGLSIIGGVLGTRFFIMHYGIKAVDGDVVALAGVAALVTGIGFLIGYPFLQIINTNGKSIAGYIWRKNGPKLEE